MYWIIRVGDGNNFKNSKYPIWGINKGKDVHSKIKEMNAGDVLCFAQNKENGGKILGFAEYISYCDKNDEKLLQIYTKSHDELGWIGDEEWNFQIHYKDLYISEKQNIVMLFQHCSTILKQDYKCVQKHINKIKKHYENFKYYGEPKNFD